MSTQALVLNASFEPLNIVSWQRAIQLIFQGKAEVLEESDKTVRTVRVSFRLPSVLRLLSYIPLKKRKAVVRFSRDNIFARDLHTCQYCGVQLSKLLLTLDHVVPVVQGGKKSWQNIVTSCKPCNQKKGGRTPAQANMSLVKTPGQPTWLPQIEVSLSLNSTPTSWLNYLQLSLKLDRG